MKMESETTFDMRVECDRNSMEGALNQGEGVLRLAPAWVARKSFIPGGRLRLDPSHLYPFGKGRGGVNTRWLGSTLHADNGPETGPYEGVSLVVTPKNTLLPFDAVVAELGSAVIGDRQWNTYAGWTAFAKFFDSMYPLPLHIHSQERDAERIGQHGKPEAYYYSPQMNNHLGMQPITYLGLRPGTTRTQILARLKEHSAGGDNRISELSVGYRTRLTGGWDVPAGILHAPASVCTYEPQAASDVMTIFEAWSNFAEVETSSLWRDVPPEHVGDFDFLIDMLAWDANLDPDFATRRVLYPRETSYSGSGDETFIEKWIVYKSPAFSAKELTLHPGATVTIPESDAYGIICVQGRGTIAGVPLETVTMIKVNDLTNDEYFVTAEAASRGVEIRNTSEVEPLVCLKHYGPGNVELEAECLLW